MSYEGSETQVTTSQAKVFFTTCVSRHLILAEDFGQNEADYVRKAEIRTVPYLLCCLNIKAGLSLQRRPDLHIVVYATGGQHCTETNSALSIPRLTYILVNSSGVHFCHTLITGLYLHNTLQYTIQYNLIAQCQYTDCTRNVLWCQVQSSHIYSNHKTLNYNNSK